MLRLLTPEECVGHTVRHAVEYLEIILLTFDHGYLAYTSEHDYENSTKLEYVGIEDLIACLGSRVIEAGVMTQGEYDDYKAIEKAFKLERERVRERAQYERLKAKFEGGEPA